MAQIIGGKGLPSQPQQPKIDITQAKEITCQNCNGTIFLPSNKFLKIPKISAGTPQDVLIRPGGEGIGIEGEHRGNAPGPRLPEKVAGCLAIGFGFIGDPLGPAGGGVELQAGSRGVNADCVNHQWLRLESLEPGKLHPRVELLGLPPVEGGGPLLGPCERGRGDQPKEGKAEPGATRGHASSEGRVGPHGSPRGDASYGSGGMSWNPRWVGLAAGE